MRGFGYLFLSLLFNVLFSFSWASSQTDDLLAQKRGDEWVIGVPQGGYPPFIFEHRPLQFSGPLYELTARMADEAGSLVRYVSYQDYQDAQNALQLGHVDALFGIAPSSSIHPKISATVQLGSYGSAILMRTPDLTLSLTQAKKMRWVCVEGFGLCDGLLQLGITNVTPVDSQEEAVYMVKLGMADAYLDLGPVMARLMQKWSTKMGIIIPRWLFASNLTMLTATQNPALSQQLQRAYQQIPVTDARLKLQQEDSRFKVGLLLQDRELAWLKQRNQRIRFAVAPHFTGLSEINEQGELNGYVADLMRLLTLRSGIQFELVATKTWQQSLDLLARKEIDLLPTMAPLKERQQFAQFSSPYLKLNSYVAAKKGAKPLTSLSQLKQALVGGVRSSYEASLIKGFGGQLIEAANQNDLLHLLDQGKAHYVLLTMTNLGQQSMRGFHEKYQVVAHFPQFDIPIAMASVLGEPEIASIVEKLLLTISDEEWGVLERRWLNVSVNVASDFSRFYKWLALFVAVVLIASGFIWLWGRSLRKQIHQRQIVENKLNEQLLFIQTLLDSLPAMVVLRDARQQVRLCNQVYRRTFLRQLANGQWEDFQHLPDAVKESVLADERRIWQTQQEMEGESHSHRPDGSLRHVIYAKRPYFGPDGIMQGVLTVLTDVTRIREAEERTERAQVLLTQITDSMPGIVYQYLWQGPRQGRFLYASKGTQAILGISHEALMKAKLNSHIFGLNPQERADFADKVANHAADMSPIDLEVNIQAEVGWRYLQVRGNFSRNKLGELLLNGTIQDISALKQQQNELRQVRANAEQAMQARSRFLATMSHELRTPISGMHGMLELLQLSDLDEDQRYLLRNVVTSTNNLLYLVNDILDFSKMEAGQLQLHLQSTRLAPLICDAIRGHATLAHSKGLAVKLNWGKEVPSEACIDGLRIGQVISNLLNNAVKFTEQGSITITVSYEQGQLSIAVSDTGIGISQDKQGSLFTPFEQLESDINRRFGGTGLGLAICQQLVSLMGGRLNLTSEAGKGACFDFTIVLTEPKTHPPALVNSHWWLLSEDAVLGLALENLGAQVTVISGDDLDSLDAGLLLAELHLLLHHWGEQWPLQLKARGLKGIITSADEALRSRISELNWWRLGTSPLYPDLLQESCLELLSHQLSHTASPFHRTLHGRVLVADDHLINRELLTRQLTMLGLDARVVGDGQQAWQAWHQEPFVLLLTDCHMPVMDGYTLTQALREQGIRTPIIGVTADTSEVARSRMMAVGMNEMLFKPYSLETLYQLLIKWLPTGEVSLGAHEERATQVLQERERWLQLFGDESFAQQMAREYLQANAQDLTALVHALAPLKEVQVLAIAHRIKGAARMVGLQVIADQACAIEQATRLNQINGLNDLVDELHQLMTNIANDIGSWLDETSRH